MSGFGGKVAIVTGGGAAMTLWHAPIYAWVLLVSAWAAGGALLFLHRIDATQYAALGPASLVVVFGLVMRRRSTERSTVRTAEAAARA